MIADAEDLLYPGEMPTADVAILFPRSSWLWDNATEMTGSCTTCAHSWPPASVLRVRNDFFAKLARAMDLLQCPVMIAATRRVTLCAQSSARSVSQPSIYSARPRPAGPPVCAPIVLRRGQPSWTRPTARKTPLVRICLDFSMQQVSLKATSNTRTHTTTCYARLDCSLCVSFRCIHFDASQVL